MTDHSTQPTGDEPSLSSDTGQTGREPFIGGEASLAQLVTLFDQDTVSLDNEVMAARLAGVLPELSRLLDNGSPREQHTALQMIGMLVMTHPPSHPQTIPILDRMISRSGGKQDQAVQLAQVIRWLGSSGDPLAAEALVKNYNLITFYPARDALQEALVTLGPVAVPALTAAALTAHEGGRHMSIQDTLLRLARQHPETHSAIGEWLVINLEEERLLWEHAYFPGQILDTVKTDDLVRQALTLANNVLRDIRFRRKMYQGLSHVRHSLIADTAWELLLSEQTPFHRVAARMLIINRRREDIPRLIELTTHSNYRLRQKALKILRRREIKAGIPAYTRCLDDPRAEVRREALRALAKVPSEETLPQVMKCLADHARRVREEARSTLWRYQRRFPLRQREIQKALEE